MKKWIFTLSVLAVLAATAFAFRFSLKDTVDDFFKPSIPLPKSATEFSSNALAEKTKKTKVSEDSQKHKSLKIPKKPALTQVGVQDDNLPAEINLKVPFASQAPESNWTLPYKEACEEASAIMVHYFFSGKPLPPLTMKDEILKLVKWQEKNLGHYQDTTAAEVGRIMREYFGYRNVEVRYGITIADIKREVAAGNPVILPAAGRLLPNPNFRTPGPIYHMLVVKGYTKTHIITNDPGTRKGADFLYTPEALMNAIHDFKQGDMFGGRKAMIVVKANREAQLP